MTEETKYDVFLSHNSADKPAVEILARRLVEVDLIPWLDTWNLVPGEPWQEAIEEALAACQTVAVFLGPSGIGSWEVAGIRGVAPGASGTPPAQAAAKPALAFDHAAERAALERELTQRKGNLYKLSAQAAIYAAGETPLHLLNHIEAEEMEIRGMVPPAVIPSELFADYAQVLQVAFDRLVPEKDQREGKNRPFEG